MTEWLLLTDSSIAGITIHDISYATILLDPDNIDCSEGRSALIALMMRQHGEEVKTEEPSWYKNVCLTFHHKNNAIDNSTQNIFLVREKLNLG